MILALNNPKACLPPGFERPVSIVLDWVKSLGLLTGIVSLIRIGVHMFHKQNKDASAYNHAHIFHTLNQNSDSDSDSDDMTGKLLSWMIGALIILLVTPIFSVLGLNLTSCETLSELFSISHDTASS